MMKLRTGFLVSGMLIVIFSVVFGLVCMLLTGEGIKGSGQSQIVRIIYAPDVPDISVVTNEQMEDTRSLIKNELIVSSVLIDQSKKYLIVEANTYWGYDESHLPTFSNAAMPFSLKLISAREYNSNFFVGYGYLLIFIALIGFVGGIVLICFSYKKRCLLYK